jgi:hypothetical protein
MTIFENGRAILRSIRPMRKNEEITIFYVDASLPEIEMKKVLRMRYFFESSCNGNGIVDYCLQDLLNKCYNLLIEQKFNDLYFLYKDHFLIKL